ncbi:MAG: hypothetical protein A3K50_09925 [Planctomycetes bacterium RIFOXYD12_FULL_42_12]|nr:MAG: hypothetical protein A2069_01755 [Planctomycetes bacterium GWB2_41_19]OHB46016.1 MAG: hypothetical protein A2094_05675 [Planctomycetes bacterium GWE2_41_14]OHB91481.1 MAG: hypothetical protein A2Z57_01955 [Planctomycetes bacterium RIFCSPHIGHO2_12_39_6]OHC08153.1 MAG: hypothetical protein A3K50_09925 [Planctomycetes bacterium RIFOXYD12_FULL_42_12]
MDSTASNLYSRFDAGRNTQDRASLQALCTNVHLPGEDISYNVPSFKDKIMVVIFNLKIQDYSNDKIF